MDRWELIRIAQEDYTDGRWGGDVVAVGSYGCISSELSIMHRLRPDCIYEMRPHLS